MSEEKTELIIGTLESSTILLLYLMSRYHSEKCIFFPLHIEPGFKTKKEDFYLNQLVWSCTEKNFLTCSFIYPYGDIVKFITEILADDSCSTQNIIVLPFTLMYISRKGKQLYHNNVLIYNRELNELERFEPHGKSSLTIHKLYAEELLDKELNEFAKSLGGENCKYISPMDYCPDIGIQRLIEREGNNELIDLCTIWTFIYTDFRLKYAEKTRDEIINELMSQTSLEDIKKLAKTIILMIKEIYNKLLQTKTDEDIINLIKELNFN